METRNNQTVAFTGHRKERILQGSGNDSRILAQIREAVTGVVTEPVSYTHLTLPTTERV